MAIKNASSRARQTGFSLVELLVVVGIMVLLLSILLPAIAASKKQVRVTETTSELQAIRSGCEQYYTVFGAYPGVNSESSVAAGAGAAALTGTQNLYLSLMGSSGSGPFDSGNSRQYGPFYVPRNLETYTVNVGLANQLTFVDHFPDALPVLYYRRNVGVDTPILSENLATASAAYYRKVNSAYTNATILRSPSGATFNETNGDMSATTTTTASAAPAPLGIALEDSVSKATGTFNNTSTGTATGGFILVAAGPSRIYGNIISPATANDTIFVVGGQ